MRRDNTIVFVGGRKGSGKNVLLDRYFSRAQPRLIRLDFVGDVSERYPTVPEAVGLAALLDRLAYYARVTPSRWAVIGVFGEPQMAEVQSLFRALVPPYAGRGTPPGLSRSFGGLAIECGECDVILPNATSADTAPARSALKRGRHEGLSLLLATQRPQDCHRHCTAQADVLVSFATHEPREIEYWTRGAGYAFAREAQRLPRYASVWRDNRTDALYVRDADGRSRTIVPASGRARELGLDIED